MKINNVNVMQTILGANGQIADELAKELHRNYTQEIRLVSRNPVKVNDSDSLFVADLTDAAATEEAVKGSRIVYLTVGLPMDTKLWASQFPVIMQNVIAACKKHKTKLVFFDNTYMYPQDARKLTEETTFNPVGPKGRIRKQMVEMLLDEIKHNQIEAVICRAPEFYGPGKTQSITTTTLFENIKKGRTLKVLQNDNTLRTLIWTPDASKALALIGNTDDCYNQTWHLPCNDHRYSYKHFIFLTSLIFRQKLKYVVLNRFILRVGSFFNKELREIQELLPRYEQDSIFDSSKFKKRFPEFEVTSYAEGIKTIREEYLQNSGSV